VLLGASFKTQLKAKKVGSELIQAFAFTLADGRSALIAFTDHGYPLGRVLGGTPVPDVELDLVVSGALVSGWKGEVRIIDHLGEERTESGKTITVPLTYRPTYIIVEP
jgi:hypothetical protein